MKTRQILAVAVEMEAAVNNYCGEKTIAVRPNACAGLPGLLMVAALTGVPTATAWAEAPYSVEWARQLGTSVIDMCASVAADDLGNAFLCGATFGSLAGPNLGHLDVWLAKYSPAGALLWSRQFGTSFQDNGVDVAVDAAGNVYICGFTLGSLGGPNAGGSDPFVAKYSSTGALLWMRQIGTSSTDHGISVAVDSPGSVFIGGYTFGSLAAPNFGGRDVFIAKYSSMGVQLWMRQLGTSSNDYGGEVAVDSAGNALIVGSTEGGLGGPNAGSTDAYLAKYSTTGALLWTRQLGTAAADWSGGVAVDNLDAAIISGTTDGSLGGPNAGGSDAFIAKYSSTGALIWTRQIGTSAIDRGNSVAIDDADNAFIGGQTLGSLGGPNAGGTDVFMARYSATGTLLWTCQIGTSATDMHGHVTVDGSASAFLSGSTTGSLGGPYTGQGDDAFIVKYSPTCAADVTGSGSVDVSDLLAVIAAWGAAGGGGPADVNGDNTVHIADLLAVIAAWGPCA